jgi:predicted Zn-dependent peptidase
VRSLDSNSGLASSLASAENLRGDWRKVFTDLEELEQVAIDDIQRVAREYLTRDNRTVGSIISKEKESSSEENKEGADAND